jgi:hypothetical protein
MRNTATQRQAGIAFGHVMAAGHAHNSVKNMF